jgi:hypothetical protein
VQSNFRWYGLWSNITLKILMICPLHRLNNMKKKKHRRRILYLNSTILVFLSSHILPPIVSTAAGATLGHQTTLLTYEPPPASQLCLPLWHHHHVQNLPSHQHSGRRVTFLSCLLTLYYYLVGDLLTIFMNTIIFPSCLLTLLLFSWWPSNDPYKHNRLSIMSMYPTTIWLVIF